MAAEIDELTAGFQGPANGPSGRRIYRVLIIGGPSAGAECALDGRELRIGKDPGNHLCIADPTVSRFHCVIERKPRGLVLRDLNSKNGTQMGGYWIECAYLAPGVLFKIGSTTLQIATGEASAVPRGSESVAHTRMPGSSQATARILATLPRVASASVTVLIEGETGTGKTLLAELIHKGGPRAEGPFIVVDCGSIPPTLIESELFGHERGSFTGATERRIGAFEAAHGGTLFLDEIGELPLLMQPKLLRALEERTIKRVGSTKPIQIDVRVIAATNRDLKSAVSRGQFRPDLYYRLEAIRLFMPSLRDRREDIPLLIEHFARQLEPGIHPTALEDLKRTLGTRKEWPGNVRELRNAVEKALVLGDLGGDETVAVPMPPPPGRETAGVPAALTDATGFDGTQSFRTAKEAAIAAWEHGFLASLLRHANGNLSYAARAAQMDRTHLRDLLRRYHLTAAATADRGDLDPSPTD